MAQIYSTSWAGAQFLSHSNIELCLPIKLVPIRKPTRRAEISCSIRTFPKQPLNKPTKDPPPPPEWNLVQRAVAKFFDAIESVFLSRQSLDNLPRTADPRVQIAGNFAPVPEKPLEHNLSVTGRIPECINGVYLRNGANPLHQPLAGHHFFDGDGMIHAVTINGKNNSVSYACRFTETQRLIQERRLGRPVFPKSIGEIHGYSGVARLMLFYARGAFGLLNHSQGISVANAGLIYFNRRLLALSEDDRPYQIRITPAGDLETVGRYDFEEQLTSTMIAHPKIDPFSGELFALSYDVIRRPYLKYFKFSCDGKKSKDVEINLETPTMIHDFAITDKFVVIPDQQVVFKLQEMIKGGSPVIYDKTKKSRFGILPKSAPNSDNIIWINCPQTFCFHIWNAWEEPQNDDVIVIASCMSPPDSIFNDRNENLKTNLTEIRLNFRTGESNRRLIIQSPIQINLEVGTMNRSMLGRKNRFIYLAIVEPWPKVSGFAKVDLSTGKAKKFIYGDERYGGEPFFVERERGCGEEDDGYVVVFVHDEKTWRSEFFIVNAITLDLEASVELPTRVPYGFHGTFVSFEEMENQVSN